jgi:hypothetical protein
VDDGGQGIATTAHSSVHVGLRLRLNPTYGVPAHRALSGIAASPMLSAETTDQGES